MINNWLGVRQGGGEVLILARKAPFQLISAVEDLTPFSSSES